MGVNGGWVGERLAGCPPGVDRVMIEFLLVGVGHAQLGAVIGGVVDLFALLPAILRQGVVEPVVVAAAVHVRRRHQLHVRHAVGVEHTLRNHPAGEVPRSFRVLNGVVTTAASCGPAQVAVCVAPAAGLRQAVQVSGREVPRLHLRGRNEVLQEAAGRLLIHVLVTEPEEELVPVAIEMEPGKEHRAADVAAGVIVVGNRDRIALGLLVRIFGVENGVAGHQIALSMEPLAAALAEGLEHNRPLGVLGSVRRHQHLDLGNHLRVDVGDLGSHVVVQQVGAIQHVRHTAVGQRAVGREVAGRTAVAAGDVIGAIEGRVAAETVVGTHAGHDLHQLAGIAARQREFVHHDLVQGGAERAGVDGGDRLAFTNDLDHFLHSTDLQDDVGHVAVVALVHDDSVCLPSRKAGLGDREGIRSRLYGHNCEEAVTVADDMSNVPAGCVLEFYRSARHRGAARIVCRAAQRPRELLAEEVGTEE